MKKSFILILILVSFSARAQEPEAFSKGKISLGGNFSGSYEYQFGVLTYHNYTFGFNSNAAYFILKRLSAGLAFSVNQDWTRISHKDSWEENHYYDISPMVRFYPWKNLFIAFEPGFVYGYYETSSLHSKTKGFFLKQGLGYDFFIRENVALEISYLYSWSKQSLVTNDDYQFQLKSELRSNKSLISFGVQLFF